MPDDERRDEVEVPRGSDMDELVGKATREAALPHERLDHRAMLVREVLRAAGIPALLERNRELEAALLVAAGEFESIQRLDKTPMYAYGEGMRAQDPSGRLSRSGSRWSPPREIAGEGLRRIRELIPASHPKEQKP